jgi:hypothetical protein
MNLSRNFLSAAVSLLALAGCGGSEPPSAPSVTPNDPTLPPVLGGEGSSPANPSAPGSGGPDLVNGSGSDGQRPIELEDACIIDRAGAALVKEPVDIVLVLDNSGSMADELAAVEQNINVNFAAILAQSGIDYRVILISRHRRDVRDEAGESSTSICVSSPLSNATDCDNQGRPAFSDHFFQYSVKIESTNSFDVLLDTFAPPFDNSGREDKFDQAPDGWSAWLRPNAKKVFLEMTDDAAEMASTSFVAQLTALSPEAFGTPDAPRFVFHSIVGVVEKDPPTAPYLPDEPLVDERCVGNASDVENAGAPYQELSRLTGGLRFPLCQFDGFDVVFRTIADDVVVTSGVACDFAIPTPPDGQALNLDQVAVSLSRADGSGALQLGQTTSLAECQESAFYIAGERINLCPAACEAVRRDPSSDVEVLFTCKSTFIPR